MKQKRKSAFSLAFYLIVGFAIAVASAALIPLYILSQDPYEVPSVAPEPFPVSVDPSRKTITENEDIEALLSRGNLSLTSAALNSAGAFYSAAAAIVSLPAYQMLAAGLGPRIIRVEPGFRKEEVADALASALGWNKTAKSAFLKTVGSGDHAIPEGRFFPGLYAVEQNAKPEDLALMFEERFDRKVSSRYSTTTEAVVPLQTALTIASLLEREAGGEDDIRLVSGIIWNRAFAGMKLQIDATLQYAKATGRNGWWPVVRSRDKYIRSAYNTYQHNGFPPGPIASPGVAAILAALNPKKTSCLYYFHDDNGEFHCSDTYEGHVALLKQYFGRGR